MNNIIEQAKNLPSAAKILAVSTYKTFLDRYPIIENIKPDRWDSILTIAGIFVGISQLNHENISEKGAIFDMITKSAMEKYPYYIDALEDCTNFVDKTYAGLKLEKEYQSNPKFLFSDSLGAWMVWNLFDHEPSNADERGLIRILGAYIVHSFVSWWK